MKFTKFSKAVFLCGGIMLTSCNLFKTYTVNWVVNDETVETDVKVKHGKMPEYNGVTPEKAATAQFSYTFSGWSPEVVKATGDVTYVAQFSETVNKYTVQFKNGEEVLQSSEVEYGETPEYKGATPVKDETDDYTYVFDKWDSEIEAVTGEATYVAEFDEIKKFSDNNLGYLAGQFFSKDGVLTITKDGAKLVKGDSKIELTNKTIKGDDFDTVATYTQGQAEYKISWTGDTKKVVKVETTGYAAEFQPSIASIQGWYTGYGDAGVYNIGYIVSNDFDESLGFFNVGMVHYSYGLYPVANYAKSYYAVVGEEVKLGWDFYYADDLTEAFTELYAEKRESGKIDLMYYDYDDFLFESSVSMFNYSFYDPEEIEWGLDASGLAFYALDEEEKTVYPPEQYEAASYVEGYDANGSYVEVAGMKIYGTRYGALVVTAERTVEMPFYNPSLFYQLYDIEMCYGESTIYYTFDMELWQDSLLIDGVASDALGLAIVDRQLVMCATKGDKVYYIAPYDGDSAIKVTCNEVESIYINKAAYLELFVREYYTEEAAVLTVDENLVIECADKTVNGSLQYTEDYGVVLVFDGSSFVNDGGLFYLFNVEEEYSLYCMFDTTDDENFFWLVDKEYAEGYFGDWTPGFGTFTVSETGVTCGPVTIVGGFGFSVVQLATGDFVPVIYGGGTYLLALFGESGVVLYQTIEQGLKLMYTMIPVENFEDVIGNYKYSGENGVETVSFEKDGTLTVDTTKADNPQAFEPVEYEYNLYMYDGVACAQFTYKNMPVNVYFDGKGHCSIASIVYLEESFFNNQGAFVLNENIISVVDNVVKYNGQVVDVSCFGDGAIDGTLNDTRVIFIFSDDSCNFVYDESNHQFNKAVSGLIQYVGKVVNVSGLGYDVEVTKDGIYWGMTGNLILSKISSYEYAFEGTEVVVKFSQAGIDYIIKLGEEGLEITGVSNIPLPPPPPPMA